MYIPYLQKTPALRHTWALTFATIFHFYSINSRLFQTQKHTQKHTFHHNTPGHTHILCLLCPLFALFLSLRCWFIPYFGILSTFVVQFLIFEDVLFQQWSFILRSLTSSLFYFISFIFDCLLNPPLQEVAFTVAPLALTSSNGESVLNSTWTWKVILK